MPRHIYKILSPTFFLVSVIPVLASAQVVNEIYYLTSSKQWVEIYNNTANSLDLTQFKILDAGAAVNGHSISLCSGVLPANGYAVVAKVPDDFSNSTFVVCKSALGVKTTTDDTVTLKLGSSVLDTISVIFGSASGSNSLQLQSDHTWLSTTPTPGLANSSQSTATSSENETGASTTTQTTSTNMAPVVYSTHYSAVPLSPKAPEELVSLSAGRDRLGAVGSPLEFKVETTLPRARNTNFKWNFGDGTEAYGEGVEHAYEYAGDYVVVLNTSTLSSTAVSRTNVRIIAPEITVTQADPEKIEVKNSATEEVNLFGRALWVGDKTFLFPQDTIVKAGQGIAFSSHATGLSPKNPNEVLLIVVGVVEQTQIEAKIEEQKLARVAYLQNQIALLRQQMASLSSSRPITVSTSSESVVETATVLHALASTTPRTSSWLNTLKTFILRTNNE